MTDKASENAALPRHPAGTLLALRPAPANRLLLRLGYGGALLIVLMSLPLPFFWDSILLGSEVGQHLYHTGMRGWILPTALDSGHPPGFGAYLALWWTLLGPTLPVAHLAMLPVLGLLWFSFYRLLRLLLPAADQRSAHWIAAGLLLLEPTLAAQAIHVGPDLMLLALYLSALVCVLERRPVTLGFLLLAMGLISLRGLPAIAALGGTALVLATIHRSRWLLPPFAFAAAGLLAWFGYHASQTGWWLANPDAAWAANQQWPGVAGILRNAGLIGWRLLDFGRVALWVPGLLWLLDQLRRSKGLSTAERQLIALWAVPLALFSLAFLPFANPIAHRYFLVVFVLALPWFAHRIHQLDPTRQRFAAIALVAMLGFGHRWIYPDKVAQGWDASLAHLPYFSLLSQAWSEIPDPSLVYTEFPLYKPMTAVRPGSQQVRRSFRKAEGNWLDHDYVLYSNIINDIPDATYDEITSTWPLQREWEQGKVFIRLYRKPGVPPLELPELEELPAE
jgi:hypothetical protein